MEIVIVLLFFLLLWNRYDIFLLKERCSVLEKEICTKSKDCNDETK